MTIRLSGFCRTSRTLPGRSGGVAVCVAGSSQPRVGLSLCPKAGDGMPAERLSMRQIREVLRLRYASKLPQRAIAKSLGLSQGAVSGYLSRARAAGVVWPLPDDVDDVQLE